jgi:hypothetical protein
MGKRVADEMARENISEEKARYILKKDDDERRKWGMFLYGIDILDPETYNLIIRVGHLSEDEAVDIIANAIGLQSFQETNESKAALTDAAMHALVSRNLFDFPNAVVAAKNSQVKISIKAPEDQQPVIHDRIGRMLADIDGIKELRIQFDPYF